ncbi:hypothetical protein [Bacillus swezeyi]|uniref:Uncharacterized protein n=1 Tax=Bacillus swezeyi TaxID=1925020 RepID=A0A5M8RV97_9BACI|nr:hypothetical protein [Bacillus swezeyi]KAA6451310.1 hypothetical protein DX927_11075 [Bacillus swezeyi]KAA6482050.1 hypothetical protein DX928_02760 [Bacillus swezeyi]TYS35531.1 hypothetical protein FZC77_10565 [Bacillus swezeyi]
MIKQLKLLIKCYLEVIKAIVGILVFFAFLFLLVFLTFKHPVLSFTIMLFIFISSIAFAGFFTKLRVQRKRNEIKEKPKFKWNKEWLGFTILIVLDQDSCQEAIHTK